MIEALVKKAERPSGPDLGPAGEGAPQTRAAEAKPVIAAEGVTLGYGRRVVLREVNLRIHEGEFWCFLGPNGEGKTTLIKALLGAVRPSRGKIFLRADFARRTRIGFVPQECDLNRSLPTTVAEFILGGLAGIALDGRTEKNRLKAVLEMLGIYPLRDRSFWTLSGGQRQRAMVARALIRDPLLLIVDEPTAGLDLAAATGLLEIIAGLSREKGITVAFVTHDLRIATERGTHAALFHGGRVAGGTMEAVFTGENLSRTFGVPVSVGRDEFGRLWARSWNGGQR